MRKARLRFSRQPAGWIFCPGAGLAAACAPAAESGPQPPPSATFRERVLGLLTRLGGASPLSPAALQPLQQQRRQQQLRVRACGCEGECAGAGR